VGRTGTERLDKHDRQVASVRELVQEGMRLEVQTRKDLRELAAAQKRADASLHALSAGMRLSGNGHTKRCVD
jgi:hypothetical protein